MLLIISMEKYKYITICIIKRNQLGKGNRDKMQKTNIISGYKCKFSIFVLNINTSIINPIIDKKNIFSIMLKHLFLLERINKVHIEVLRE